MNALTEQEIITVLENSRITNPFRYLPEVAEDFQFSPEESGDYFRDFVHDELSECADAPVMALKYIADDLTNILAALRHRDPNALPHPYFSQQQVCVLQTYLGEDTFYATGAACRDEALYIITEIDGDRFKRLMLAALDRRNGHSSDDVQHMFAEGIAQMDRAISELQALKQKKDILERNQ